MPTVSKFLEPKLKDKNILVTFFNESGQTDRMNATSITVTLLDDSKKMMTFRLPRKKSVNVEWVLGRIERRKELDNRATEDKYLFADLLESIMVGVGIPQLETISPTQYGFGIVSVNNGTHKRVRSELLRVLDSNEIKYNVERSRSNGIEQYIIGKSNTNLKRVRETIDGKEK